MKTDAKRSILVGPSHAVLGRAARGPIPLLEPRNMQDDSSISDDPGTILDSYESVPRALPGRIAPTPIPPARPSAMPVEEVVYKSPYRWTAPRIVICDDGSLDEGETIYVRSDKFVIGRTTGDAVIGHDVAMSSSHAEIARRDAGGKYSWVLRDLGSSNGTLVRARNVTLKPGLTILLGSKRYRFEVPGSAQPAAAGGISSNSTAVFVDLSSVPTDSLPALVESSGPGTTQTRRYPFTTTRVTIGRPGCGNIIEIDDLCLARNHAVVTRDVSGVWQLEALPSLNGVWVKVDVIRLTDNCHFQCGEQRFRFRLG